MARKPPPVVARWVDHQLKRKNDRALNALEQGLFQMKSFHSWRQIQFNAPPGSKLDLRARDEAQKHATRAQGYFDVVRAALGYRVNDEDDPPERHWDAGA
jgi:hypothetical protein